MQIQQQYGIEALKRFALKVLDLAKLDKDGDGKISTTEWGQAVFALVPELLNIKQLSNETRDLTVEEITELIMVVSANFPDYRNLRDEVEAVIRAALKFLAVTTAAGYELLLVVKKLNKQPVVLGPANPVEPEAPATKAPAKGSTEAKKQKMSGK